MILVPPVIAGVVMVMLTLAPPVMVAPEAVTVPVSVGVRMVWLTVFPPVIVAPEAMTAPVNVGVTMVGEVAPTNAPEPVLVPVNPCTEVVAVSWTL